jgi:hypothetical protein
MRIRVPIDEFQTNSSLLIQRYHSGQQLRGRRLCLVQRALHSIQLGANLGRQFIECALEIAHANFVIDRACISLVEQLSHDPEIEKDDVDLQCCT